VLAVGIGFPSLLVAILLVGCIVIYDARGKRIEYIGSFNMGACRLLNVMLGASGAFPFLLESWLWLALPAALLVFLYISAVTLLATGEVWGGNRIVSSLVLGVVLVVTAGVLWLGLADRLVEPVWSYPFLALFAAATLGVIGRVVSAPTAAHIRTAIKTCVLSLLLLDAAIAAGAGGLAFGIGVAVLILPALYTARLYAVT
jgi:4-hydroxybenzoate polyprenyltransferase